MTRWTCPSCVWAHQAPAGILETVRRVMMEDGQTEVTDLHVWTIGPGRYAAAIAMAGPTQVLAGQLGEGPQESGPDPS